MSIYMVDDDDTSLQAIGKGLLAGGTMTAGVYGLNELRKYLVKKLFPKRKPPEFVYFEKNSGWSTNILPRYLYGASATLGGAYGTIKLLDMLKDKYGKEEMRGIMRDLEGSVQDELTDDFSKKDKATTEEPSIYFAKDSAFHSSDDVYIKGFVNGFVDTFDDMEKTASDESDTSTLGWLMSTLYNTPSNVVGAAGKTVDIAGNLVDYLPIAYGGLSGLGALAGWEIGKRYYSPDEEDDTHFPLSHKTELLYKFKRDQDEQSDDRTKVIT